ncbi:MAG: hypothetical protein NT108_03270 [Candidatus Kaiserbacteria bacterium]|nr:hypothetical protein [Candidatus Kaiserbacteria bacterium]
MTRGTRLRKYKVLANYAASGSAISEALAARRRESEADFQQKITLYSEIALPLA